MEVLNVHEAKTQLSKPLERVAAGEEIVIARSGRPIAKLVPLPVAPRRPGRLAGRLTVSEDFDAPLPGAIAPALRGESD